jgi:leucine dehydrogenase
MLQNQSSQNHQADTFLETFEQLNFGDVHIKRCEKTGLIAIIAIHNTILGPSLGGVRCVAYPNFNDALNDAIHLAKGMSFKAAISKLPHGGGKAVIMAPETIKDRVAFFESFAQFIDDLGGRYITAEDSGVSIQDMDTIKNITPYVTGYTMPEYEHYDPSPLTAIGVRRGIEAAVKFKLDRDSLDGIHVAIKGVGKVGSYLCQQLHERGASLTVADIHQPSIERILDLVPVNVASVEDIHKTKCDVYAPCALSFTINDTVLKEIKSTIIAGAANNQLASLQMGEKLMKQGILYAPDYAINAGGLIHVSAQYARSSEHEARQKVEAIYETLMDVFEQSEAKKLPTNQIADSIALVNMQKA